MNKTQGRGPDDTDATARFLDLTAEANRNPGPTAPPEEHQGNGDEELTYEPVPPRRSIPIRVTCRLGGRGKPLPFPEDDS